MRARGEEGEKGFVDEAGEEGTSNDELFSRSLLMQPAKQRESSSVCKCGCSTIMSGLEAD